MSTPDTTGLPDYAPVPSSALGPALGEQGYFVGRVERNLYWITDGSYQSAFLTTSDGVGHRRSQVSFWPSKAIKICSRASSNSSKPRTNWVDESL